MRFIMLMKMSNDTYSRVWVRKHLLDTFPTKNGFETRRCFMPPLFNFALEYSIRMVQGDQEVMKLNGTQQLLSLWRPN